MGAAAPDDNLSATTDRSKQFSITVLASEDLHSLHNGAAAPSLALTVKQGQDVLAQGRINGAGENDLQQLELAFFPLSRQGGLVGFLLPH